MGIHVKLRLLACDIDTQAWAQVYDETLSLLQRHPAAHLRAEPAKDRSSRSAAVHVRSRAQSARRRASLACQWRSADDGVRRRRTACSADIAHYRRARGGAEGKDVLLFERRALEGKSDTKLASVFDGKTQGTAVHIPLLACAMLAEDRFPGLALAGGEIDREQAEAARVLASEAAGHEVRLPVRLDPSALLERLGAALSGEELAEAFATLLITDESVGEGVLAPLVGNLPRAAVERWFAGRIGGQHTVDLFVQWLNATSDLKRLCELACIEPWGPRMKVDTFIGALARTWIGYPGDLRRRYAALRVLEGRFLGLSVLMSIMPGRNLQPELDEKQIHEALRAVFGDKATGFGTRLTKDRAEYERRATELEESYGEKSKRPVRPDVRYELLSMQSTGELSPELARHAVTDGRRVATSDMGCVAQADSRGPGRRQPGCGRVARSLRELSEHGPILTEGAWEWILAEQDVRVVQLLMAARMLQFKDGEWDLVRRAMFENRALFHAICDAARGLAERQDRDEQLPAEG